MDMLFVSPVAIAANQRLTTHSSFSSRHVLCCRRLSPHQKRSGPVRYSHPSCNAAFNPEHVIRDELLQLAAYTPVVPPDVLSQRLGRAAEEIVKLDANENPYGPALSVSAALAGADASLHMYPDAESTALRAELAEYTGVPDAHILVGAGADELIVLLLRLFLSPAHGDSVVNCPPTFGMAEHAARVVGATVHNVPRRPSDFSVDVAAVERLFSKHANNPPKIVFIASPNNPDGAALPDAALHRLLRLPALVVLDEAYVEFVRPQHHLHDRIRAVPQTKNLAVLRTFSKWAGLAGVRLGYGAFPLAVVRHLWKIRQPYSVSVAAQLAGVASLRNRTALLTNVGRIVAQRERFYAHVSKFPWLAPFPASQTNYVLCRVLPPRAADQVQLALAHRGVIVRYYPSTEGLSDCVRISMGTNQQMERLFEALSEV